MSTKPTNQLSATSKKAVLMSGKAASVKDELGVLFGFIVRLYPSDTGVLRLQIWRPNPAYDTHYLACQKLLQLPANISYEVDKVDLSSCYKYHCSSSSGKRDINANIHRPTYYATYYASISL